MEEVIGLSDIVKVIDVRLVFNYSDLQLRPLEMESVLFL